ncbi:MAG: 30S ribosomal protein S9 [Chloroflexi bacterium]|nr:30S ribosomal protein S9 [Chloroflexota bacterium]
MTQDSYFYATGKRKEAVARVRLYPGSGDIVVNGRPFQDTFARITLNSLILQPLRLTETLDKFNVMVKVAGGGVSGQAGAIACGISRALVKADEGLRPLLRKAGLLTRDPRTKERKKYGLKRARKAPQYTKR